ncbi:MAG: WG repeat-containing protein [Bacteroidales bacterium]|nr:WG repeat-containing protein [Bacteroidales bacterium]
MKKLVLLTICLWSTIAFAQEFDTIRLPKGNITITPELAKELLLYSYITINDSSIIGESMNFMDCHHCNGYDGYPYYLVDVLRFRDQMEDWGVLTEMGEYDLEYRKDSDVCVNLTSMYSNASHIINGYAIVRDKKGWNKNDDFLSGVMDNEGLFMRVSDGRRYALINKQGKECIPFGMFDKIKGGVYDNLIPVCKQGKWGFAAPNGVVKIIMQYSDVRHFSEGLAAVKKDGKWGYIDTKGVEKIPFEYVDAYPFKNGVAVVRRKGTTDEYCDESTITGGLAVGLVDHEGHSTYDYYGSESMGENPIHEYSGVYVDDITGSNGYAKYTYYDVENSRVKHGYYVFVSSSYIVEGHYKDGKKHGRWLKLRRDKKYLDWATQQEFINKYNPIVKKRDPSLPGYYYLNQLFIIGKDTISPYYIDWPFRHWEFGKYYDINYCDEIPNGDFVYSYDLEIRSHCSKGQVDGDVGIEGFYEGWPFDYDLYIPVNKNGNVSGEILFSSNSCSPDAGNIPIEITLTFYKGVPMRVAEYNESTGERKTIFEYPDFTSVDSIKEYVSNGVRLYKIGDLYYEIEPKDPRYPFDIVDVDKYNGCISEPLSFLLNLPASWPVPDVKSPQLNFFRRASRDKIKGFEWPKYSNVFDSYSEYSQAYDQGDAMFKQRIEEKLEAKQIATYNLNKHLFLSRDEFMSYYKQGEIVFNSIVNQRNTAYKNYKLNAEWFIDFHEYLKCSQRGRIEDEVNARKTAYEENKENFTGLTDFIWYYVQGKGLLFAEINMRMESYERCKDPDDGYLFKNMAEFLPYYLQGTYNKEYAIRRLQYRMNDFVSLNLKGAKDSKKEEIKQFFVYLAECKAIYSAAYPQMIGLLVSTNKKMSKEWEENGQFFVDEVEFYEAYITDDYKSVLKTKKKQ